jgi:hypothetical protein
MADTKPLSAIERAAGVKRQTVMQRLRAGRTLQLDVGGKLAARWAIECWFVCW